MSRLELVEGYARGDITRRTFVRRLVALGVSLSAALSYAELVRPATARAAAGEQDFYETHYEDTLPPDAVTQPPTGVTHDRATAHALVDPNLQATDVRFEFGPPGAPAAGTAPVRIEGDGDQSVAIGIEGLQPASAYVVRVVASNARGTALGEWVPFQTGAAPVTPTAVASAAVPLADTARPKVSLRALRQSVDSVLRTGAVRIRVGTDEDATLEMLLTTTVPARGPARSSARGRTVKVAKAKTTVRGGRPKTVRLRLTRAGRRALRDRDEAKLALRVRAKDAAGNRRVRRSSLRLS